MSFVNASELANRRFLYFSLLCCLVYFISYMTRLNYVAAISEIVDSLQISNQLAAMAVVGSFITYGIGQPICGFLGDRIHPRLMIAIGLTATAICNLSVAVMSDIDVMTVVWSFNGFFQAMLWPPLVRIMAQTLPPEQYRKASVGVTAASAIGTIAIYALVPVCILISSWRLSFILPAVFAFAIAIVWYVGVRRFADHESVVHKAAVVRNPRFANTGSLIWVSGLVPIMLVNIMQGSLRDGITTWMPTYIDDVYHLGNAVSILSTAVLPIFTIVSVAAATYVQRIINNELKTSALFWTIGFAAASVLATVYDVHAALTVLLMSIITGCMHGVNMMLISLLPLHFVKYGRASTITGILNSFTYVGSAVSIYGFAALSEHYTWQFTMFTWSMIAFMGTMLCILCVRRWGRFVLSA